MIMMNPRWWLSAAGPSPLAPLHRDRTAESLSITPQPQLQTWLSVSTFNQDMPQTYAIKSLETARRANFPTTISGNNAELDVAALRVWCVRVRVHVRLRFV